jgi:aspartyl-tRNA(Asn)/glutamyl-tRNA(Gln) amidotransferase subunit B
METHSVHSKYEPVIGLEIHAQLLTKTKAFSPEAAEYGALPNHHVSVINLGHPGTLPMHNKEAVKMAIKVGLACSCHITENNIYARKNYFYADLPKGYQITQDKTPLCTGGSVKIKLKDGEVRHIGLIRIHMEEDSGKSIHDMDLSNTLLDFNRAGTTLVEIVTEPEIRNAEEAFQFVTEIRKLLRYLEVCDGNMEEGSLRCDANISVRPKGSSTFGTKVEIKNMNSITNVKKAIEHEIERQIALLEKGEKVMQETRSFDAQRNLTFSMRSKELVTDYRYFPEPDLLPLHVNVDLVEEIKQDMPLLPEELYNTLRNTYQLSSYDAQVLTESRQMADYFLSICQHTANYKSAANWLMGDIKGYLNNNGTEIDSFPLKPESIAQLIALIDSNTISHTAASQIIFPAMIQEPEKNPMNIAQEKNVIQESDDQFITELAMAAIELFPDKVIEYRNGKKGVLGLFMGEIMKRSQGKADPKVASKKLVELLETP